MANYGSLDTSAYRNLIDANRMKTEAITSTIGNLGNLAAGVIEKRAKNKKLAGIDVTDLAKDAGVKWEGMESGTKLSMLDASRMDLATLQTMASLVKSNRETERIRANTQNKLFWESFGIDGAVKLDGPDMNIRVSKSTATDFGNEGYALSYLDMLEKGDK